MNNTPPKVLSTSIDAVFNFTANSVQTINLSAITADAEQTSASLTYLWKVTLHHNTHSHPELLTNSKNSSFSTQEIPCDGNTYYYEVKLTVTDTYESEAVFIKYLYPNCNISDVIPPNNFRIKEDELTYDSFKLVWESTTDNVGVLTYDVVINGEHLALLNNSVTSYTFYPKYNIARKIFECHILASDLAGNETKSSPLYFYVDGNNVCNISGIYASTLPIVSSINGLGSVEKNQSVGGTAQGDGNTITLNGIRYPYGFGTSTYSEIVLNTNSTYGRFMVYPNSWTVFLLLLL